MAFGGEIDGVGLFWRPDVLEAVGEPLRLNDSGVAASQIFKYRGSQQNFRVLAVHLKSGHDFPHVRQKQVGWTGPGLKSRCQNLVPIPQLSTLLSAIPVDETPLVVVGDFNAEATEVGIHENHCSCSPPPSFKPCVEQVVQRGLVQPFTMPWTTWKCRTAEA